MKASLIFKIEENTTKLAKIKCANMSQDWGGGGGNHPLANTKRHATTTECHTPHINTVYKWNLNLVWANRCYDANTHSKLSASHS